VSVVITTVPQKPRQAVVEIFDCMAKRGVGLDDLIQVGGEDLKSSSPKHVEKAVRVAKCWSLMARLSVKFADLEQVPGQCSTKPARRRSGEGSFSQVIENKEISSDAPGEVKPLKNNDKTDDHSVGVPGKGRWKSKRQLVSALGSAGALGHHGQAGCDPCPKGLIPPPSNDRGPIVVDRIGGVVS
jgi:hypothetical protein